MKSKLLASVLLGVVTFLAASSVAVAWSGDTKLSGSVTCAKVVTWKVTLSGGGANPQTPPVVQSSNRAIVPVGLTLTQGKTFVETVSTFPVTLTITVKYPASQDHSTYSASATIYGPSDCPTTTTSTTVKPTTTTMQPTTTTTVKSTTTTVIVTTTTAFKSTTTLPSSTTVPPTPELARTGMNATPLAFLGFGLVLLGGLTYGLRRRY